MGSVRIVAGELRGRRLPVPAGRSVRPTSDRVREALFSILGERVRGARVLDAYSGTGALGFEALSRGAAEATFIESDPGTAGRLEENARRFGVASRCRVLCCRVLDRLAGNAEKAPFDLVFADPPYGSVAEVSSFLGLAGRAEVLAGGGSIVIERDFDAPEAVAPGLERARSERYGSTRVDFYYRSDPD